MSVVVIRVCGTAESLSESRQAMQSRGGNAVRMQCTAVVYVGDGLFECDVQYELM